MKSRQKAMGLAGLIVIAVTLVLFFLPGGGRETVDWVCLTFLLLAELILFGGGVLADRAANARGGTFFRAGAFSALLICCLVSAAVSLASILWVRPPAAGLVGVQLVVFAVGTVLLIVLSVFGRRVEAAETAEEQALNALRAMEDRARALAGRPSCRPFAAQLERLAEAVRYADGAAVSPLDAEIAGKLAALETYLDGDAEAQEVDHRVEELLWDIGRRGREVKAGKAGRS